MKKAKIVLTATLVTLVIGGAFAFNAHRTTPDLFYCDANTTCQLTDRYTDVSHGSAITPPYTLYVSSSTPGATCGASDCQPIPVGTQVFVNN